MSWDKVRFAGQVISIDPDDTATEAQSTNAAITSTCPSGTHSLFINTAGPVSFTTAQEGAYVTLTFPVGETPAIRFRHIRATGTTATGIFALVDPNM